MILTYRYGPPTHAAVLAVRMGTRGLRVTTPTADRLLMVIPDVPKTWYRVTMQEHASIYPPILEMTKEPHDA